MASKYTDAGEGKSSDSGGGVKPLVGTGNERKGSISSYPQEVQQCCTDILSWMKERGPKELGDVDGCLSEDLQLVASKYTEELGGGKGLPGALSNLLEAKDGGIPLYEYNLLRTKEILRVLEEENPPQDMLPIGIDIDGEYLMLAGSGKLHTWDPEEKEVEASIAESFASHLEAFRNLLLSNKFEWEEDCGLVEIAISPKKKSAATKK